MHLPRHSGHGHPAASISSLETFGEWFSADSRETIGPKNDRDIKPLPPLVADSEAN
jgi:hypothetical protein